MLGNVRAVVRDTTAAIHTCKQESQLAVRDALADTYVKACARMARALEMAGRCQSMQLTVNEDNIRRQVIREIWK